MTIAARKQQLHQYIDIADEVKINAIFEYIESNIEPASQKPYDKWDDPEFVSMIERRTKALEDGTDKGLTWEEVKQRARSSVKA
jgi:hypothetical protein